MAWDWASLTGQTEDGFDFEALHSRAWRGGGIFALLSLVISLMLILRHLTHFIAAKEQIYVVRILLMVPVYVVDSWLSLRWPNAFRYWKIFQIREVYESFVLYYFVKLLLGYVGGDAALAYGVRFDPEKKHPWPLSCITYKPGWHFIRTCRQCVLQYTVLKTVCACASVGFGIMGVFKEGHFTLDSPYFYIFIINNITFTISLYYLALFYIAGKRVLSPYRPVMKFMVIKLFVFLSYWQSLTLTILVSIGVLTDIGDYSSSALSMTLQDLLICVEMFFASLAHTYAFPSTPYEEGSCREGAVPMGFMSALWAVTVPLDVLSDIKELFIDAPVVPDLSDQISEMEDVDGDACVSDDSGVRCRGDSSQDASVSVEDTHGLASHLSSLAAPMTPPPTRYGGRGRWTKYDANFDEEGGEGGGEEDMSLLDECDAAPGESRANNYLRFGMGSTLDRPYPDVAR